MVVMMVETTTDINIIKTKKATGIIPVAFYIYINYLTSLV